MERVGGFNEHQFIPKHEPLGVTLVLHAAKAVKKGGMWVPIGTKVGIKTASNVLVIGGRPKAAQERWFGRRPKAAFIGLFWRACVCRAAEGRHRSCST